MVASACGHIKIASLLSPGGEEPTIVKSALGLSPTALVNAVSTPGVTICEDGVTIIAGCTGT
jgi:hypothetical protein